MRIKILSVLSILFCATGESSKHETNAKSDILSKFIVVTMIKLRNILGITDITLLVSH